MGWSELNIVKSLLRLILVHLIKAWAEPRRELVLHWVNEALNWRLDLVQAITPAMRQRVDLDKIWTVAVRQAQTDLLAHGREGHKAPLLPALSRTGRPLAVDQLCEEPFDLIRAACALSPSSNGLETLDLPLLPPGS